ncbi:hypothetical protein CR513_11244, partial [Mucuna pruriens]
MPPKFLPIGNALQFNCNLFIITRIEICHTETKVVAQVVAKEELLAFARETESVRSSFHSIVVQNLGRREATEVDKLNRSPMEKLLRPCEKEYMRMTMLKHEDTFREQVYELHRLYQIQKILMKNMEASKGIEVNQRGWNLKNVNSLTQNGYHKGAQKNPKLNFDLERPATDDMDVAESDSDGVLEIINETEIELTLGPSSYNGKKVETPLTSDSAHSLSSSSTGSNLVNKTRLKTPHSSHSTIEELSGDIIGLVQVPHSTGCQNGIRNSYDIEEQSRQERSKQPPWFFQSCIIIFASETMKHGVMSEALDINTDIARLSHQRIIIIQSTWYPIDEAKNVERLILYFEAFESKEEPLVCTALCLVETRNYQRTQEMEWRRFLLGFVRPLAKGVAPSARTKGERRPSFLDTELMNDLRGRGGLSAEGEALTAGLLTADLINQPKIPRFRCHSWHHEVVAVHNRELEPRFGQVAGHFEQHVHMPLAITSDSPSRCKLSFSPCHSEQDEPENQK